MWWRRSWWCWLGFLLLDWFFLLVRFFRYGDGVFYQDWFGIFDLYRFFDHWNGFFFFYWDVIFYDDVIFFYDDGIFHYDRFVNFRRL